MNENILLISLGSVAGFVMTTVTGVPWWLTLLMAFGTGFFLYMGKEICIQIIKRIKNKCK